MATYRVIGKGEEGKHFDDNARDSVIAYCLQKKKTPHHLFGGRAINIENAAFEMDTLSSLYNNNEKVRLRHSVISFDSSDHINLKGIEGFAKAAVNYFGDRYQIIYSVHEDTEHYHVHLVMNQVSYLDGRKYTGTRKEHYDFINYMRSYTKPYGISFNPVSED